MNIFVLLCVTSFFTISKQQQFNAENETHVIDILGALQKMSKDSSIVLLTQSDPFVSNASVLLTDEESDNEQLKPETDEDLAERQEESTEQSPKIKNILRWMPTRKPYRPNNNEKREARYALEKEERNSLRARQLNEERVAHVMSLLKNNFWMTVYIYGEVRRILNTREVVDDIRQMILFLDTNEEMREKVLECYRKEKNIFRNNSWNKKANNLLLQVLKDPVNDNVVA